MSKLIVTGITSALLASTSPAHAQCGDFGGLGVLLIGAGTEVGVLVTSLIGAGIARENDRGASYWTPFGWSMLGGSLATVASSAFVLGNDCDAAASIPLLGVGVSVISLALWDLEDHPESAARLTFDVAPLQGGALARLTVTGF